MAFHLKDNRGMFEDPIILENANGLTAENVAECMKESAVSKGVSVSISVDVVKEGGIFGKSYPCVVIRHPNLSQEYFTDVYIINNNIVNFYFFGYSKAVASTNKANIRKNTISGAIINKLTGTSEMDLQQEMFWHRQVIDLFKDLLV